MNAKKTYICLIKIYSYTLLGILPIFFTLYRELLSHFIDLMRISIALKTIRYYFYVA